MTNRKLFLDIHAIQTLPPSNINRDDTGSPKTAQYGGVTRARVSSQSWKRAIREYFETNDNYKNRGYRSRELVNYLAGKIASKMVEKGNEIPIEDAVEIADNTLKLCGLSTSKNQLKSMFFISDTQLDELTNAIIEGNEDKKSLREILSNNNSLDISLFGRMLADDSELSEEASCQFAHAISTHAVEREFDYFTAVDDLSENNGAGMIGSCEFNSSTVYRYANIALHELYNQMDSEEALAYAVDLFIRAFVESMPQGKINSYANQTLPDTIVISLREDRPLNLITAFEVPVKSNDGYVKKSTEKLFKEIKKYNKILNPEIFTSSLILDDDIETEGYTSESSLNELIKNVIKNMGEYRK